MNHACDDSDPRLKVLSSCCAPSAGNTWNASRALASLYKIFGELTRLSTTMKTMLNGMIVLAAALVAVLPGDVVAGNATTLSVSMVPNVTVTGSAGTYALQYASVLGAQTNWVTLTQLTLTGSATNWLDYSGVGKAQRFYRTVALSNGVSTNLNLALLVWIPAGTFTMGSPTNEALRDSDEAPHTVTLSKGFYMSKYLVRQGEYLSVMGSNPSYFTENTNYSVDQVSWFDAANYCVQLNQIEQDAGRLPSGWAYRLPTEAEWEYACRAGTTTAFNFGDSIRAGMANFYSYNEYNSTKGAITTNSAGVGCVGETTPVGSYIANPWGLYDMCGNLWEWCQDWYGTYPSGKVTNPTGATDGSWRVKRGGSWNDYGEYCRSAFRSNGWPDEGDYGMGFRIVLAQAQP